MRMDEDDGDGLLGFWTMEMRTRTMEMENEDDGDGDADGTRRWHDT